jgi:hypothetical protein
MNGRADLGSSVNVFGWPITKIAKLGKKRLQADERKKETEPVKVRIKRRK